MTVGSRAAAAVARRSGHGTRRARSDAQAAGLDVGDAAAAGADRVDRRRRAEHVVAVDLGLHLDLDVAVDHETDIEARAAHVDAHETAQALTARRGSATAPRRRGAADGPESSVCTRVAARLLGRDDPPARLHHPDRHAQTDARRGGSSSSVRYSSSSGAT